MSMLHALSRVATVIAATLLLGFASHPQAAEPNVPTRAGRQYMEVLQKDGSYAPLYVKGMNLSVAIPGHHPSEFPRDEQLYRGWLKQIADMNCNVIRLYTILPPDVYNALAWHNKTYPDQQLWLIQGVWVEPPPDGDFLNQDFMNEVELNIRNAVNLVHGNANFDERPGWTGGRYKTDVSKYLLGWLLGREWEPDDIEGFHKLRPDFTSYKGQMVSCPEGQPIEAWFAQILDYCVTCEDKGYNVQHPVAFSSWPPTDPLSHVSESNLEEEVDLTALQGESRVDIFSSDAVNITSKHFTCEPGYDAGLYASYHVYPYWPDFLDNEPAYSVATDRYGLSNFAGYLRDLKNFYNDRPLLIAEYGLPNSPCTAHLQKQGWNHGGLSEEQVAHELPRLTEAVYDTGCAGGVVFSWTDEWFKKVWLWAEFYNPWDDRRLWYNLYDPEKNYGMLANLPGATGPNNTLSGNDAEWASASTRPGASVAVGENAPSVQSVQVMHDEGYLHLRIKLANFSDWEFADDALYLGFDVLGEKPDLPGEDRGNTLWPGPLNVASDRGLEEVISVANRKARLWQTETYRFWTPYPVPWSDQPQIAEVQPHILEVEANRWQWFEPEVEVNRRRVGRDGSVYPARFWPLNPLPRGSLVSSLPDYSDQSVWNINPQAGVVEIRMPWILLGFVGPHQMRVLQAAEDGSNSSEVSPGVGLAVIIASATGKVLSAWPGYQDGTVLTSASERYSWPEWGLADIKYHSRLKPVYDAMRQCLAIVDKTPPQPAVPYVQPADSTPAPPAPAQTEQAAAEQSTGAK